MILVSFCCNDERGAFTGRVESIQVGEWMTLEGPTRRIAWIEQHVRIGRRSYRCGPRHVWIGNVFWDGANMSRAWARALVQHLLAVGWYPTKCTADGPFADLVPRGKAP